ncbi:hypothetical protein EKO23_07705 [Nocardioides guangzhouensis]|uniref:DUF7144 domain-containing protein n=1 Tax=Nocardioides guangzhouensis TaxID=2497878 RepID=A0A4Q4ZH86_9ACTN|nr:hypothetical protein [Nocardioides guangzhouensis]RYP86851.1 hypothetical protein EKO23_07705 [Nocardioides guangzhouensis]
MTEQPGQPPRGSAGPSGGVGGFTAFAGILLLIAGSFQAIMGLAGILEDEFFVVTEDYFLKFDASTWGWIHLLFGLAVALVGLAVLRDQAWGRTVGVVLAGVSMLTNFAFLPYYPGWTLVVLTLDVIVIWALTAGYRGDY